MNVHVDLALQSRVAVIDDDDDGREDLMDALRDLEFEPVSVTGVFDSRIADLVAAIEAQRPCFVICDHRLQPKQMAQFYGTALVKELIARKRPAMLVTTYGSSDRLELRKSRFDVPVIVDRDVFRPECLQQYFEVCQREIDLNPVDERKPHRSLIRIDSLSEGGSGKVQIDAIIPSWRPEHAVPVPIECIAEDLRGMIGSGTYLLGDVNIGACKEEELYFHNVNELAPLPSAF